MDITLGTTLKIRSTIHVASEPIPYFWPMRTFIHHNPLHGFEGMYFADALEEGKRLFHGRVYLPRETYQQYYRDNKVDRNSLRDAIKRFSESQPEIEDIDYQDFFEKLSLEIPQPISDSIDVCDASDIYAALQGEAIDPRIEESIEGLTAKLTKHLLGGRPVYEAADVLHGTQIGEQLNEWVINSCLDFFDEGQSVWGMPERQLGFFKAWRDVVSRNAPFFLKGVRIGKILSEADTPEAIIAYVLQELGVKEEDWLDYFTSELVCLHGWVGFIRWRNSAKNYYWTQQYPGDLVDYLAIRMTLGLALLRSNKHCDDCRTKEGIAQLISERPKEAYLRAELHQAKVLPQMAHKVEMAVARKNKSHTNKVFNEYLSKKKQHEASFVASKLEDLATRAGAAVALKSLSLEDFSQFLDVLVTYEKQESLSWLRAMEDKAIKRLLRDVNINAPRQETRPFAQAMFCIDTRSERIRRSLEGIGDYQTYGIAGFFGVPVSFMEHGKGSEMHLCPVILTPKNLVPEISLLGQQDEHAMTALEHGMHDLKEQVLTPFVTVEAIGLLFGFDMIGKTVAPSTYNRWRKHLHPEKPTTRYLLDKLSRKQADSIIRATQRAVIIGAVQHELKLETEDVSDDAIRELRELAMENVEDSSACAEMLGLSVAEVNEFVVVLRDTYHIKTSYVQMQMEKLGRIGFTLDEQANYVGTALRAIGLTENFSRFVLIVGHGSQSENNPYESALDCGACGGNHGIVSARVLAQMANKPLVRRKLRASGLKIPDDTWFMPAMHNTTSDEIALHDLEQIPASHLIYIERLQDGITAAARLCAHERMPTLGFDTEEQMNPAAAYRGAQRNSMDWSQVRPEWGLSRNCYFIIGRRELTQDFSLDGRSFLHSYDYRVDPKGRLLATIMSGPLVVGQWINMEHYFSAVDNDHFGSGSKVNHNVAGRFGVMTGNLSDLRTGLPSQTVLKDGKPYHEPIRLITVIEAPFEMAKGVFESVTAVKNLVRNAWIRMLIVDPETGSVSLYERGEWKHNYQIPTEPEAKPEESLAS